ncbi:hypothetical protein D3C86_1525300 [compost metagenome]
MVQKWAIFQRPPSLRKRTFSSAQPSWERPSAKVAVCSSTQVPSASLALRTSTFSEVRKCTLRAKCAGGRVYFANMARIAALPSRRPKVAA